MKKISKSFYSELVKLSNKFDESGLEKEANLVDSFLIQIAQTDDEGHVCKDADKDGACDICGCDSFKVSCAQCGDTASHKIGGEDGIIKRSSVMGAVGQGAAQGTTGAIKGGAMGTVVGSIGIIVGAIPGGKVGAVVGGVIGAGEGVAEGSQSASQQ